MLRPATQKGVIAGLDSGDRALLRRLPTRGTSSDRRVKPGNDRSGFLDTQKRRAPGVEPGDNKRKRRLYARSRIAVTGSGASGFGFRRRPDISSPAFRGMRMKKMTELIEISPMAMKAGWKLATSIAPPRSAPGRARARWRRPRRRSTGKAAGTRW